MIRVTKKLKDLLTVKQQYIAILIALLMFLGGLLESLSVTLIFPLISAIMDTTTWSDPWYAQAICRLFQVNEQTEYIKLLLLLLILMFVIKNVFLLFEYYIQYSYMTKCSYQIREKLITAFFNKPYAYYLNASSGEIVRIITSDTSQAFSVLSGVMGFFTELIVAIILAVTIIIMSWEIAFFTIIILFLEMVVITYVVKPILRRMGENSRVEGAASNKWLFQSINGIKSIKVANKEAFFRNRYLRHERICMDLLRKSQTLQNAPRLIIESCTVVGVLGMLLFFVNIGADIATLVPQLSAFMVAAVRLLPSVNRIAGFVNGIPFQEGGLDNVIQAMRDTTSNKMNYLEDSNHSNKLEKKSLEFDKSISFRNISFSYDGSDKLIFSEANFEIHKGQSIGLIGSSGAGKTTAVDIILGLLKPTSGEVLVDGCNIEENMSAWLNNIAYIPQSIFLMDDSIAANVAFGTPSVERDEMKIWNALREAQMEEFVKSLPHGIHTQVGEQGVRLSGGQRQRIGIARALYNDPEVLFFDEATSALDNETETAIMESIDHLKGKRTMVIIAHRLTTIENCDVVYKVEKGQIFQAK